MRTRNARYSADVRKERYISMSPPGAQGMLSPEGSGRPGSRPGPAASPSWQCGRSGCLSPLW